MKFKCIFASLLKVFIASLTIIYGNFAAPAENADVTQEELQTIVDSLPNFEGEGVRDRNDRNKNEKSRILQHQAPGKDAKIVFHEYKNLENGNYFFE